MRKAVVYLTLFCVLFGALGASYASSMSQPYIDNAAMHEQKMHDAGQRLLNHDPSEWSDAALADYQVNMGAAVYNATVAYCFDQGQLPGNLEDLVGCYLTQWPLNPQTNWEPVKVLGIGEGFASGEIVYQECPFSYYSIFGLSKDNMLTAQSFELSVYGPRIDHYQESSINLANEDWGVVPAGTIIQLGMYCESAYDVLARRRAREAAEASKDNSGVSDSTAIGEEEEIE